MSCERKGKGSWGGGVCRGEGERQVRRARVMHLRPRHVVGANQRGLLGSSGSPWGLCCALGTVHTPEASEGRC